MRLHWLPLEMKKRRWVCKGLIVEESGEQGVNSRALTSFNKQCLRAYHALHHCYWEVVSQTCHTWRFGLLCMKHTTQWHSKDNTQLFCSEAEVHPASAIAQDLNTCTWTWPSSPVLVWTGFIATALFFLDTSHRGGISWLAIPPMHQPLVNNLSN